MCWFADFYMVLFPATASPVLYFNCSSLLSVQMLCIEHQPSASKHPSLSPGPSVEYLPLVVFLCKSMACRIKQDTIFFIWLYIQKDRTSSVLPQFQSSPRTGNESLDGLFGQTVWLNSSHCTLDVCGRDGYIWASHSGLFLEWVTRDMGAFRVQFPPSEVYYKIR